MRDANRLKEKYDLSLDSRQIVSLVIAGLVVLGAVFVLGLVVGKNLPKSDQARVAPDLLTALDERAAAMDADKEPDASLTFPDALTAKEASPPLAKGPAAIQAPEFPVDEAPVPPKPAAPEVAAVPPPSDKPDAATPTRVAINEKLQAALKPPKKPAEAVQDGAWTLQLSASQDRGEADKFATRLKDQGYAPYIVEAAVPGRGTWYRVRMGSFATKDAATRYLKDFRRETQLDAFVTGTN
jgi:DedD protein